jgi:serine/threonine protein kinase/alpha-tubulin suppressor-like RCC1 family protein
MDTRLDPPDTPAPTPTSDATRASVSGSIDAPQPSIPAAITAKYEIVRELGRGGTALVYLARERASGAEVAIKVIRSKFIDDEEALARFAREASFVAQLQHPNIVPVRAVLHLGDAGIAIVMAHLAGRTLKQEIKASGRLTPARAEHVLRDIASALNAAHAMGIVHRDVKPENIFIDHDGRAVLADFGLARSMKGDTQLTMNGVAIGTPAYMAPEQIDGADLDARADVYSLGLVGWEMLAGRRPWDGETLYAILYHQKHDALPDVRDFRGDVPDRLAEVIVRATQKEPSARWASMRELLTALDTASPPLPSLRHAPKHNDTVRFVRPPTDLLTPATPAPIVEPTAIVATPMVTAPTAPAFVFDPELVEELAPRESTRTKVRIGIAAAVVAAIGLAAVAAIVFRGRAQPDLTLAPAPAVQPTIADVTPAPVATAPPAESIAIPQSTAPKTVPPAQSAAPPAAPAATAAARDSVVRPPAETRPVAPGVLAEPSGARLIGPVATPTITLPSVARDVATRATIVTGGMHSCLMSATGRVLCWGSNERNQLGRAAAGRAANPPSEVSVGTPFFTIAAGLTHSCGIARGGSAWCWGNNESGQLGDGSISARFAPVRVADAHDFRSIATGSGHTCGLDTYGLAWCWGANGQGQLGDSSTYDKTVPIAVIMGGLRFTSIAAGWNFTCGLTSSGRASCWGENAAGQLGDASTSNRRAPVPVASNIAFASLSAGGNHTCGMTADGTAYCWGRNTNGQLGDGTTTDHTTPVRVRGSARFASITAGAVHTCAVTEEGSAYCWGRNTYGQLGNGQTSDEPQPALVADGHVFAAVRAFGSHTCGVTVAGQPFCWGYNLDHQLGDGTRTHRTRPVRVETPGG